jgi:hypothetical protein
MRKHVTKDCPSCRYLKVEDDFICGWGKAKKRKVLINTRVRGHCNLNREGKRSGNDRENS